MYKYRYINNINNPPSVICDSCTPDNLEHLVPLNYIKKIINKHLEKIYKHYLVKLLHFSYRRHNVTGPRVA